MKNVEINDYTPQVICLDLPVETKLIEAAEFELTAGAIEDVNDCRGFFPSLAGLEGMVDNLPCSELFATKLGHISLAGRNFNFNFLRLSTTKQESFAPYHIDSDTATALTGDVETLHRRLNWRLLLNLSCKVDREFAYLDQKIIQDEIAWQSGYLAYDRKPDASSERTLRLRSREGTATEAVLFCANKVLHRGNDGKKGHFVAAYGFEEETNL